MEKLLIFGVDPQTADDIVKEHDNKKLECWLCNTPIMTVIQEMLDRGWLKRKGG